MLESAIDNLNITPADPCSSTSPPQLPTNHTLPPAVTLPNNFVSAFHAITADLDLPLPWPKPSSYIPEHANSAILIWGGSSSVGQFALQILRYYGYRNLLTTASKQHHELLKEYGARECFDYRDGDVVDALLNSAAHVTDHHTTTCTNAPAIAFILDCIGSQEASIRPISKLAQTGAKVAILLPVIVRDASEDIEPIYAMDVNSIVPWKEGVEVRGVRTHSHLEVCCVSGRHLSLSHGTRDCTDT